MLDGQGGIKIFKHLKYNDFVHTYDCTVLYSGRYGALNADSEALKALPFFLKSECGASE